MSRLRLSWPVLAALLLLPALSQGGTRRLTQDLVNETWGPRSHVLSGANVLMAGDGAVYLNDGTDTVAVQEAGNLGALDPDSIQLATGGEPNTWIAGWARADAAFVWTYRSDGLSDPPVKVTADSPLHPGTAMVPLEVAVADGCAFVRFADPGQLDQGFLYAVDPTDGTATSLTVATSGDGVREVVTDGCKAAYAYDTGRRVELRLFDGQASAQIDIAEVRDLSFKAGRLVYTKIDSQSGASDVYLWDTNLARPTQQPLSPDGHSSHGVTDGTYVVWLRRNVDASIDLMTLGNIPLVTYDRRPVDPASLDELGVQVDSGQVLWKDRAGNYEYDDGTSVQQLELGNIVRPVLQGGKIAYLGRFRTENDNEAFVYDATPPADGSEMPPPLRVMATAGDQTFTLEWSPVFGATSYAVFMAEEPGANRSDYLRRYRGQKLDDKASGVHVSQITVSGKLQPLENQRTYYVSVSAKVGALIGPSSREINVTPGRPFELVPEIGHVPQHAVAAMRLNPLVAYAGGGRSCDGAGKVPGCDISRSGDRATTWANSSGNAPSVDPHAIFMGGTDVVAVSSGVNGNDVIYQSIDEGQSWVPRLEAPATGTRKGIDEWVRRMGYITFVAGVGSGGGMQVDQGMGYGTLAPPAPGVAATGVTVRGSVDSADIWFWGGGTTRLLKLHVDKNGSSWSCDNPACPEEISSPPGGAITAFKFDEERVPRAYAATDQGMFRTDDGITWMPINVGLPEQPHPTVERIYVFDTGNVTKYYHEVVLIATDRGLFRTVDAGLNWSSHNIGLPEPAPKIWDLTWVGNEFGDQNMMLATEDGLYRAPWRMPDPHAADLYLEYHCAPGQTNDPRFEPAHVGEVIGCEAFINNAGPATARDLELDLSFENPYFDLAPDSIEVEQGYCEDFPTVRCYLARLESKGAISFKVGVIPKQTSTDHGRDFIMGANLLSHTSRDPLGDDNGFNVDVRVDEALNHGGSGGGGAGGTGGTGAGGTGGSGGIGGGSAGSGGTIGSGGIIGGGGSGGAGGAHNPHGGTSGGCGCDAGKSPAEGLLLAVGLALALRRRKGPQGP